MKNRQIIEFNKLNLEGRTQQVLGKGQLLCSRNFAGARVFLYSVGNFWAEVWFSVHQAKITNIIPFTTTKCLEVYLPLINIDELFEV